MKNQNLIDAIAPRLTELMIQRIEHLETDWQKPWITDLAHGLPRNNRGSRTSRTVFPATCAARPTGPGIS